MFIYFDLVQVKCQLECTSQTMIKVCVALQDVINTVVVFHRGSAANIWQQKYTHTGRFVVGYSCCKTERESFN